MYRNWVKRVIYISYWAINGFAAIASGILLLFVKLPDLLQNGTLEWIIGMGINALVLGLFLTTEINIGLTAGIIAGSAFLFLVVKYRYLLEQVRPSRIKCFDVSGRNTLLTQFLLFVCDIAVFYFM